MQNPLKKIGEWMADAFIEKATAPLNEMKEELGKMSKRLDGLEKLHEQDAAALEADLSMMDDRICYLISMCRQRGYTTSDERRRITRLHDAYRARGGNHGEENEYARFLALPTEEEYNRMKGGMSMKINWKDVLIRAIKTFVEAFVACAGAELAGMDLFAIDKGMWCAVALSAGAAGLSAIWNGMIEPWLKPKLPAK